MENNSKRLMSKLFTEKIQKLLKKVEENFYNKIYLKTFRTKTFEQKFRKKFFGKK
jgi:hypothetical protein